MSAHVFLPDWQARVQRLLQQRATQPFAWGAADCCTWAADCWQAMTGVDPMAEHRGAYRGRHAARALVRRLGGLRAAWEARLGAPTAQVLPGSIVLARQGRSEVLGLAWGIGGQPALIGVGDAGLVVLIEAEPLAAWRASA